MAKKRRASSSQRIRTQDALSQQLTVTLTEKRKFKPPRDFTARATVSEKQVAQWERLAQRDPQKYWADAARELAWFKPWKKTLDWKAPHAQWFLGGKLNAAFNCLDRHVVTQPQKAALIWEGEPGETVTWTYTQLLNQVQKLTAGLRDLGLKPGDRVAIYMPLVPEAVAAMLACARGGFTHTVVFGGFSAEALKDRVRDAQARVIITADGGYRKGAWVPLLEPALAAAAECPSVENLVVLQRAQAGGVQGGAMGRGALQASKSSAHSARVTDYYALLASISPVRAAEQGRPEAVDSEHPLFILYTSGTTGKPKGIVHSTGGYLTGTLRSMKLVFDLKPQDLYWCTADIGWITGHTYLVYGPLAAGATLFLYEGAPTYPAPNRIWSMIERHRVSILYTAPTAIRAFMKAGSEHLLVHDLSSLRLLGTVGEPINPEAWMWYRETVGSNLCPIVDTYWQTETGSAVIAPIPSVTPTKPGSATRPLPGYDVDVVDQSGKSVPVGSGGYLVIRKPWPSMARTIHGDPERFKKAYWSDFPGVYFTGDGARKDRDGYIWCLGRVDDVLNVSGHRLGTMEIESALVAHPSVAEAAVVGRPDEIKGQGIVAFVTLKSHAAKKLQGDSQAAAELKQQLRAHVTKEIGALARPDDVRLTESLPKTRSGKIMRRLLRELAVSGQVHGDTSTLEDFSVIAALQKDDE